MRNLLTFVLLAAALLSPAAAHADTLAQIRAQITAVNNRFGPAVRRHDAATIVSDYLPDGVLIPRKGAPIRGRAAIARYYVKRWPVLSRYSSIHCATERIAFDGTAVLEEGSCTFTLGANAGKAPAPAHFLTIWKQDSDGRWRIAINA